MLEQDEYSSIYSSLQVEEAEQHSCTFIVSKGDSFVFRIFGWINHLKYWVIAMIESIVHNLKLYL